MAVPCTGVAAGVLEDAPSATRVMWQDEAWPRGVFALSASFPAALRLLPEGLTVAHCVSREFSAEYPVLLARGFARSLEEVAGRPPRLPRVGDAAGRFPHPTLHVVELVTKATRWSKPTLRSLRATLVAALPIILGVGRVVCVPRLGCGRDGLAWPAVVDLLRECWGDELAVVVVMPPGEDPAPLPPSPVVVRTPMRGPRRCPIFRAQAVAAVRLLAMQTPGPWSPRTPASPLSPL